MVYLLSTMMTIFIISILYIFLENRKLVKLSKYLMNDLSNSYSVKQISEYTVHMFSSSNVINFNVVTNGSYQVGSWCLSNNKIFNRNIQDNQFKDFIAQVRKLMYNL